MKSLTLAAILATITWIAAPLVAQPALRTAFVDPFVTGTGITPLSELPNATTSNLSHFVAVQSPAPAPKTLLVYLPGTGGVPANSQEIVKTAAQLGYHVVSIAYHNFPSVAQMANNTFDPTLHGAIRRERLFGENLTTLVNITPPDSVVGRLVSLLNYLDANFPNEGWGAFLTPNGMPLWSKIVVGGHSQGAGNAAYLAKEFRLTGAILFAGVGDYMVFANSWPNWVLLPNRTPLEKMYAFTHTQDPFASIFFPSQIALQIPGAVNPQNIDGLTANQITSHTVTSTIPIPSPLVNAHGSVVVDSELPRDAAGAPIYLPVWRRMLRISPADLSGDGVVNAADLASLLAQWGSCPPPPAVCTADITGDGIVNAADLASLLASWGAI